MHTYIQSQSHTIGQSKRRFKRTILSIRNEPKKYKAIGVYFTRCTKMYVRRNACYYFIKTAQNDLYIANGGTHISRIDFSVPFNQNDFDFNPLLPLNVPLCVNVYVSAYHDKNPKPTDRITL